MNTNGRKAIDFLEAYIKSIPPEAGNDETGHCEKVEDALSALKEIIEIVQCSDAKSRDAEERISALGSAVALKTKKAEALEAELNKTKTELDRIKAEHHELESQNADLSVYKRLFGRIFESGESFSISVGESRKKPNTVS